MAGEKPTLTRRSFLKATALTAGAAAAVGAAGCTTVAEQSEESAQRANGENTYTNWCRGNCGGPCNLTGLVREGKLVKTTPTIMPKSQAAYRKGCVRGNANPQRIYGTNRNLYPMKQTGERGSDNWERISWDEALDMIAEKFKAAEEAHGPKSVGVVVGCGNAQGVLNGYYPHYGAYDNLLPNIGPRLFLRKSGYTEFLYSSDATAFWMSSMVMPMPMSSIEDIANSKAVFMWGTNLAETGTSAWPFVCEAREKGAKVVCIDPQYTRSAANSDIWVPLRVGTDAALMLAMCNYIIENDLIDYDYLSNGSVAPLLIKEDGTYLRLSDLGMDPVDVEDPITGEKTPTDTEVVYDESTGEFGSSFAIKNPALKGAFDANGIKVRTVFDAAVENIKPFTAEFAAEECGISLDLVNEISELYAKSKPVKTITWCGWEHTANSWRNYFAMPFLASLSGNAVCPGGGYNYGYTMANNNVKAPSTMNMACLDVVKDEELNYGMTAEYLPQIMETGKWKGEDYPIDCLFITMENTLGSRMGPTYMKQAFEKVGFIVVADPLMTYTAQYADLVLPISLSWETEDFCPGSFMMQKAVDPLGECKSEYEMWQALSAKMGYDDIYTQSPEECLREILDAPENIEQGLGYDDYKEKGVIFTEDVSHGTSMAFDEWNDAEAPDLLDMPGAPGVEMNPTRRTQFFVEVLAPNNDTGEAFALEDRLPNYERAFEGYRDNPLREKYPLFVLNGFHNHYFGQTFLSHIPWLDDLRGFEGEPYMLIHPKRAEERGIATGDTVKAYNDHGYVVCKAVVSSGIQEETVRLPHGYDTDQYIEGNPQDLSPMAIDPVCGNNNFNDALCEVEKL